MPNLGMSKHRTSGVAPKSPKLKHAMKREAEANERKAKPATCSHSSVSELMSER